MRLIAEQGAVQSWTYLPNLVDAHLSMLLKAVTGKVRLCNVKSERCTRTQEHRCAQRKTQLNRNKRGNSPSATTEKVFKSH